MQECQNNTHTSKLKLTFLTMNIYRFVTSNGKFNFKVYNIKKINSLNYFPINK